MTADYTQEYNKVLAAMAPYYYNYYYYQEQILGDGSTTTAQQDQLQIDPTSIQIQ